MNSTTTTLSLSLVLVVVAYVTLNRKRRNYIPGPFTNFGIGDPAALQYRKRSKMHEYRQILRDQYGPVVRLYALGRAIISISDGDLAKQVLTTKDFKRAGVLQYFTKGVLDNALFVLPTGDLWKSHRKLIQPAFGPSHIRDAAQQAVGVTEGLVSTWNKLFDDQTSSVVNIHDTMHLVTIDIIGKVAFGIDFQTVHHGKTKDSIWNYLDQDIFKKVVGRLPFPEFLWDLLGLGVNSKAIKSDRDAIYGYMKDMIKNEQMNPATGSDSKWGMNVLQRLISDNQLSEAEAFGEMVGFYLAGSETTSNTLTFLIWELCKNPMLQDRLYEEVKNVRENHLEALPSLPFLENIVKETQRLHSIVPVVERLALNDVSLNGYDIKKGDIVVVDIAGVHVNPKHYDNPLVFDPDRWLSDSLNPNAFLAFSDGPHNCIGRKMAIVETKLILLGLIQNFRFVEITDQVVDKTTEVTSSIIGFKAAIEKRN